VSPVSPIDPVGPVAPKSPVLEKLKTNESPFTAPEKLPSTKLTTIS
jgi:hypothetical protein